MGKPTRKVRLHVLLAKRLLSLLLVLAGVAAAIIGGWFTNRLGTSGTATFTLKPTTNAPIMLEPTLLNRLTTTAVVTITPVRGQEVWVGSGGLGDTRAAVGSHQLVHAEGVDVRDGVILTTTTGEGVAEGVTSADLWRRVERSSSAPIVWTVAQSQTPDSLLVVSERPVQEISVSWTRKSWFFQSLVLALLGIIGVAGGLLMLRASFRRPVPEDADDSTALEDAPEQVAR